MTAKQVRLSLNVEAERTGRRSWSARFAGLEGTGPTEAAAKADLAEQIQLAADCAYADPAFAVDDHDGSLLIAIATPAGSSTWRYARNGDWQVDPGRARHNTLSVHTPQDYLTGVPRYTAIPRG
jgi:hypothetical protein